MQAVHELGHISAALLTKAEIQKVILHPLAISQTIVGENPHPLIVVWFGPITGALMPLLVFLIAKFLRCPYLYLFRFFAGFCLVVNGVYIAFGPSKGLVDSAVMLKHGCPRIALVVFGLACFALGLYLWHNQGKYFGLGQSKGKVSRGATIISTLLLLVAVMLELSFGL